ncbi:glycosyl transferase family 2 [Sphingobacterium sp. Ag1]|uniref:GtrA family protein n=1 Tax=Sphingobacterium sp. Ag1 TaxID=1643451 RepID=UPI0006277426|nr:GtrA family protein [Sphingobacterium sp. Ag1]KKO92471.1 glycosyl transferase family 2 [Sphingobacterium sp. Ag1]
MLSETILKFVRFGIVGSIGFVIDFSITYLLKEKLKVNKFVANSFGFSFAVINNYLLNRYWTFQNYSPNVLKEFSLFFLVCSVGLLLNNIVLYLLNEKVNLSFYSAKIGSISVVMFWNFIANYFYVFHQ